MAVDEIVGNSILVLMFSLAGAMILNMFLGFGITKTEVVMEPPASEQENTKGEHATPALPKDYTKASNEISSSSPPVETEKENAESENNWRCACEGGFLPQGMLKSFGGAEAVMRLGTGQCYHKQGA